MNGRETASSLVSNTHHTSHVIYGFNKDDHLFAILTFKDRKDLNGVKNLYGRDILAEVLPKSNKLDTSDKGITNINRNFMMNNFESTTELN